MSKLKIGVVGAGLIGQVEHIPNLLRLSDRYELVGVADASPGM
jgi:predicted dehydrogenase